MARRPLFLGPIFSAKDPRKPADRPSIRMASEKVQVVCDKVNPISTMIGRVSTLHAYTLPMDMCSPIAASAISQRISHKKLPFIYVRLSKIDKEAFAMRWQ